MDQPAPIQNQVTPVSGSQVSLNAPQTQPPPLTGSNSQRRPFPWMIFILMTLLLIISAIVVGIFTVFPKMSGLDISDQPFSSTVLINKVDLRFPQGGYLVIQANSGIPEDGEVVGNSGYMPAGVYENIGIDLKEPEGFPNKVFLKPGEYYYGILYAENDGRPGINTGTDTVLKDIFGKFVIKRFLLQ